MDALDRLILSELSYQCRVSFSKLAEKFDVSLTTIKNRVEALVEEGVILRFVVQLPLDTLHANFAVIMLDIRKNTTPEDLISLGNHPFIMAFIRLSWLWVLVLNSRDLPLLFTEQTMNSVKL
ncbi:MAG: Lrp/AsnC family transcriptional regulator [Candidatus Thorarchaeota archaeon]